MSATSSLTQYMLRLAQAHISLIFIILILPLAHPLAAQSAAQSERARIEANIRQLEGQLVAAQGDGAKQLSARIGELRLRLFEGDFQPGDAIALSVRGEQQLTDTFTVEQPRELRLPGMSPIDLTGVLWDEVGFYLQRELSRYLRNPEVTAHAFIRLGVLGAVGQPGFYLFRPERPVPDILSAAGGFATNAKGNDAEVRRMGERIIGSKTLRLAMAAGWNLRQLQVRAGDEIYVPAAGRAMGPREWLYVITGLVGLSFTLLAAL